MYLNIDSTVNQENAEFELGALGSDDGEKTLFEYIKFNDGDDAMAAVAGHLVVGLDAGYPDGEATNDPNSATIKAITQHPKGLLQAVLTDGYFGWAQCWGRNRKAIITDGNVAQGERLMPHATTTGGVDTHSAGAVADIGVALEADGTTSANQLDIGQAFIQIRSA